MITCPQCSTKNPKTSTFCSKCGLDLTAAKQVADQAKEAQRDKNRRTNKRTGCGCLMLLIVIVIVVAIASNASQPQGGSSSAVVAQATDTPPPTPGAAATETSAPATETSAPADTPTPQETETPQATMVPTASPQQQTDFRAFYAQFNAIQQGCTDAATVAQNSFSAVSAGTGDSVTAYGDAQSAQDACDQAKNSYALLAVPSSLSGMNLDTAGTDMFAWATDEGNFWNDVKKVLEDNSDVASAADAKKMGAEMQAYTVQAAVPLAVASVQLKVSLDNSTPTAAPQ